MSYKGNWAVSTAYVSGDTVTDATDISGLGAGVLLYCGTDHTSEAVDLSLDWEKDYWMINSGTNSYYNNSDNDGGPTLIEGTLATASEVEDKFNAVAAGFDKVSSSVTNSLLLSASDNTTREISELAEERANKNIGFNEDGDLALVVQKGTYKGDWTTATLYRKDDTVKDAANATGYGADSIIVCATSHTSTALAADITNWDVFLNTGDLDTAVAAAQASETSADTSATNAQLSEWEAVAEKMTADSYATEAQGSNVIIYTSNGDGTYTATTSSDYSALHYSGLTQTLAYKVISATPPVDPTDGQEWTDSATLLDHTWYEDGDSGQWVQQYKGEIETTASSQTTTELDGGASDTTYSPADIDIESGASV